MFAALALIALAPAANPAPEPVVDGLKAILAVGREGAGNEAAAAGWKQVVAAGPDASLVPTLAAFDTASPTAANWLRTAVDALAASPNRSKDPAALLAFVKDQARHPAARRIAFELAANADPAASVALLQTLVNDRSVELRRDAIASLMPYAKSDIEVRELFEAARDPDQCEALAKKLQASKQPADLTKHYGLVTEWVAVGPFKSPAPGGYSEKLPPEVTEFRPFGPGGPGTVEHNTDKLAWRPVQSDQVDGVIDFNRVYPKAPDVVAYIAAVVDAPDATPVEVRVSTPNAVKVFLNGEPILAREAYHQGSSRDQYTGKGALKKGPNVLMLKVCQDHQSPPWAKEWSVSARLCDETGGKLPLKQLAPAPGDGAVPIPLGRLAPAPKPAAPDKEKK